MGRDRIWYVAYGSNVSADRLQRYLDAGPDATPPTAACSLTIDHRLFFAHESRRWGGGTAFIDPVPARGAGTLAVAWSVTVDQFADVLRGENRTPDLAVPLDRLPGPGDVPVEFTGRRYGLVLGVTSPDERPAFTFTTPEVPLPDATSPVDAYVDTIIAGLMDTHGVSAIDARSYLSDRGA